MAPETLRDRLDVLELDACLKGSEVALAAGLDALRSVHAVLLEHHKPPVVWRAWEQALRGASPDAYQLVLTWLDAPEAARRQYFCEDDLPPSWQRLDAESFVLEAISWFDVEAADLEHALHSGVPADREAAVLELMELRRALLTRFDSTYDEEEGPRRVLLADRLGLMWDVLVDPWDWGFTPRGRLAEGDHAPAELGPHRPRALPLGGEIADPDDVAARDRVRAGWRRQRAAVDREIAALELRLGRVLARAETELGATLDATVREAVRIDQEIGALREDIVAMQNRVASYSTGRPWIDRMLRNGWKRRAVRRLERRQDELVADREVLARGIERAVERGAIEPFELPGGAGVLGGDAAAGQPGPGNWLAGLPGAERGAHHASEDGAGDVGIPEGTGWVERRYEGPLPLPSGTWSDEVVGSIRNRHPELDGEDARILLGLVRLAYDELPDRLAVEAAVARSLDSGEGLRLLGEERTLSELWVPGRGQHEQPVVTFVLRLWF